MTLPFALFTYFVTWCITLFLILPVRRIRGWRRKLCWNSLLAALVTLGIHCLLKSGWIPVR